MSGWHKHQPRTLRKLVVALTRNVLEKKIADSESRGWLRKSEVRPHRDGIGILMEFPNRKGA
jgi:hypothetical protein